MDVKRWAGTPKTAIPPAPGRIAQLNHFLSTRPVPALLAKAASFVAFVVVLATAWQISQDIAERQQERADRSAERVLRAFETLARHTSTDIGKGEAISIIFRERGSLDGLRIGCGDPDPLNEFCLNLTNISGMEIEGKPFATSGLLKFYPQTFIVRTVFEDAIINVPRLSRLQWVGTFDTVTFRRGVIVDTRIAGNFKQTGFVGMRLRRSNIAHISGAVDLSENISSQDAIDQVLTPEISVVNSDLSGTSFFTPPGLLLVSASIAEASNPPYRHWVQRNYAVAGVTYCEKIADDIEFTEFTMLANFGAGSEGPNGQRVVCIGQMTEAEARKAYPAAWASIPPAGDQ